MDIFSQDHQIWNTLWCRWSWQRLLQRARYVFWYSVPHVPQSQAQRSQANTKCVRERRGNEVVSVVVDDSEVCTAVKWRFAVALRPDREMCPEILWQAEIMRPKQQTLTEAWTTGPEPKLTYRWTFQPNVIHIFGHWQSIVIYICSFIGKTCIHPYICRNWVRLYLV